MSLVLFMYASHLAMYLILRKMGIFTTRHWDMSLWMNLLAIWTHLMSLTLYCLMMDTPSVWYWSGWGDPHIPAVILFAQWWWSRGYWGGEISACRGGPWTGSFSYSPLVTPCSPQCWRGSTRSPSPTNTVYANDILWYDYLHFFHFGLYKFYTCIMFWPWFLHSTFMRLEKLVLFLYSVSLLELFDSCCFYTYLSREVLPLEWFG